MRSVPGVAFVDEALRGPSAHSTYVLAAAICAPADVDACRERMRALRLPGQRKVHWRDEPPRRRDTIIGTIGSLPMEHVVIVRDSRGTDRPERQRRKCLEHLLVALDRHTVGPAVFEARGHADDKRDRDMVAHLRAQKILPSHVRVSHVPGPRDPMLWVPDAVCGALTASLGGDGASLHTLAMSRPVEVIHVPG